MAQAKVEEEHHEGKVTRYINISKIEMFERRVY